MSDYPRGRGRGGYRGDRIHSDAPRNNDFDEKAQEGANIVRPLAIQIAEGVENRNMDVLAKAISVTYTSVCAKLKEVKTQGIMFPRQKFLPEIGKNPLSSSLLSFLKTKYIFETSTKSTSAANSSDVAWTTIFDGAKGIASGIVNGTFDTPLPSSLLWELMNETIFVFGLMNDGRNNATPADPNTVLRFQPAETLRELQGIVNQSGFSEYLAANGSLENATENREVMILGLFAQITIVIINVLTADFRGALRAAEPLLIFGKGRRAITELSGAAYISLYYHVGVAYMMLRRYTDAAQAFATSSGAPEVSGYVKHVRTSAKNLLTVVSILAGLNVHDESAEGDDETADLRRGHLSRYRAFFFSNSPRFVTYGLAAENQTNPGKDQVAETFIRQVQQQLPHLTMRGYFNVYTTMSLEKVAAMQQNSRTAVGGAAGAAAAAEGKSTPIQIVIASQMAAVEQVHKADEANPLSSTTAYGPAAKLRIEADCIASVPSDNFVTDVLLKRIAEIHGQ